MPPALFFFLRVALAILGLLWFHVNFRIICSSSVKKDDLFLVIWSPTTCSTPALKSHACAINAGLDQSHCQSPNVLEYHCHRLVPLLQPCCLVVVYSSTKLECVNPFISLQPAIDWIFVSSPHRTPQIHMLKS